MKIVNIIIFFSVISSFAGSKVQLPEGRSWYNHHFAMTNWFYKYSFNDPELHAKILAEGGYQGAMLSLKDSKERWDMLPRYIESFKKHQLAITAIHCRFYIEDGTYPEIIKNNLHLLKNSPVLLIPSVGSRKKLGRRDPKAVEMAVKILQEMSDDAKKYNLGGVATYIHINNWIETIDDGIFIAEKANRDNVGTIFHLHHWTKVEMRQHKKNSSHPFVADQVKLSKDITRSRKYLMAVIIQGQDKDAANHQIVGEGSFNLEPLVRTLREIDFKGPLGTMGYTQKGDIPKKLKNAYTAWDKLISK